ncbi:uncharacterized protein LOC116335460 isoform X2 [Oreochromis aureus]|uniref:uncharacterized protein LOC116335460 isoform X2 n=1 Tax=Oreochromis aureus TaxID=47969 RepID=UPI001952D720|nr:uncharacterized protein LOC116335460 isoform X2 [Oreochromis aureus]
MQLPGLIGFISVLILACNSKDKEWKINVERTITAQPESTVTIHCNFSYPQEYHTNNVTVLWKMSSVKDQSKCKEANDKRAFVFHPNNDCVHEEYRNKTKLVGDRNKGNCSLQITNIRHSVQKIYVRIYVEDEKYSFIKDLVSVSFSINGTEASNPGTNSYTLLTTEPTITKANENDTSLATILSVAIPVAVLVVIILLVAGIFIFIKYKRSRSVTREDSGYYANFSRALSNPPKREVTCDTQAKKLPEGKAIDDPVYINVKAPTGHMAPNSSSADNIYANVDYRT